MGLIPAIIGVLLGPVITKIKRKKKLSTIKNIIFSIVSAIVLLLIFIQVQVGTLYITGTLYGVYEIIVEKIEATPEYKEKLPYLYDVINELDIPEGYVSEGYGKIEQFENILRTSNPEQVLMAVEVKEYKNLNGFTLQDVKKKIKKHLIE